MVGIFPYKPPFAFTWTGHVVPAQRMTSRSKHIAPRAHRYLAWKDDFGYFLRQSMVANGWDMIPGAFPLSVTIEIYAPPPRKVNSDLDNVIKAVLDASQGIVFEKDMSVDKIDAWRSWGVHPAEWLRYMVFWEVGVWPIR